MLELVEIQKVVTQGMTRPLLCKGSDGKTYYAKGRRATASGLIKEWMAANLAKAFALPIPDFKIAYIDPTLVAHFGGEALEYLGAGDVFVSEQIPSASDFKYHLIKKVANKLQRDILLFDLWIENADRTLSEGFSGNPNLLWESSAGKVYIIDHNLAFDSTFDLQLFWETHVCRASIVKGQLDVVEILALQTRLENCLQDWSRWWDKIPVKWQEQNEDSKIFNPDAMLQRLKTEAQGGVWSKWL